MAAPTTHQVTMVKAYTIDHTSEQVSSESIIIIPCDSALDVYQAAQQYSDDYLRNTSKEPVSLRECKDDNEIQSEASEASAVVCAFGISTERSLDWVKSAGTHIAGADLSGRSVTDRCSLMRFLGASIWTYLADTWGPDMAIGGKITLFSGKTCMSLSEFKTGLELLVDNSATRNIHGADDMKRTFFWQRLVEQESPSRPTGSSFTYSSHTFPRVQRSSKSRFRSPSDPQLLTPRTRLDDVQRFFEAQTRNAGHNDSETSDSAEEGDHGS